MVLALIRAAGGCRRLPEAVKAGAHARLEPVVSCVPGGCRRGRRIPPGVCRTRAGSYEDAERVPCRGKTFFKPHLWRRRRCS